MMAARRVSAVGVFWRGIGWWKWPCVFLLALCIWLTPQAGRSPNASTWSQLPERKVGPIVLRAATNGQLRPGEKMRLKLLASGAATQSASCRISGGAWQQVDLVSERREVVIELAVPADARSFLLECAIGAQQSALTWDLGRPIGFF